MVRRCLTVPLALWVLASLVACAPETRAPQLQALARWEDRRLAPADSLSAFIAGPDATVRRAALRTAGLIGRTDALPAMIAALQDDRSQAVRAQAAFSLGLLGGEVAVPPLIAALHDPHQAVRVAACEGLAHQDHDGAALLPLAVDGTEREATAAWTALRQIATSADHDSLLAAMRSGLARPETAVRWRVLRCAERAPDSTLVAQIVPFAGDRDVQVRVHALRALGRHAGTAAVAGVLRSVERRGRLSALDLRRVLVAECRALGSLLGPVLAAEPEADHTSISGRAAAALVAGAESDDPAVAEVALAAMAALATGHPLPPEAVNQESLLPVWRIRMVRVARTRLDHASPAVRGAARGALGALRGRGALPELRRGLDDPDPDVIGQTMAAIIALEPEVPELRGLLARARADDPRILTAALAALAARWPDVAPSSLLTVQTDAAVARSAALDALAAPAFPVRATAAELLGRFPEVTVREALMAATRRDDEGAADVQLAVIGALRRQLETLAVEGASIPDTNEVANLFWSFFDHPDQRLRLAAREAASATGVLPPSLIPTAASLRETLPAVQRDPAQPPVTLPFDAPEVRVVTDRGAFVIRLAPEIAPNTCATFLALARAGFHDNLTFHRVVPDFVIQGGCPRGDGWGGPGWTIRSEWSRRPFQRGTVGIAHSGKDTGGSQWFVCHSPQPHLNGRYTVFGEVIEGLEVVDRIERGDTYRLEILDP